MSNPIGWCTDTINPFVGCSHCSPACDNCYAEKFAARLSRNPQTERKYAGVVNARGKWTGEISALDMSCFDKLPKRGGRRVFVGSMTDFFHENADFDSQGKVLAKIAKMPQHTFLLLTKRPENARRRYHTQLPNVWLGVTVCNQEEADAKIPVLLRTPAAKRFISVEPMLGPVNVERYLISCKGCGNLASTALCLNRPGSGHDLCNACDKPEPGASIDWVICGGENGPGARLIFSEWAHGLRDQCVEAGVPFYFKGWGRYKKIPAIQNGMEWHQFPE